MLVKDVMTTNLVTVTSTTPVVDAQRIMKERNFRRLPVVDNGKLVGMVTQARLEQVKPRTSAPLLWQITYLISHTSVGDVMRKKVVTVRPLDTLEQAVAKAQATKVGTLLVVDKGKPVGICTTNDFFYRVLNPVLGLGQSGSRIIVTEAGDGKALEKVIACINKLNVEIHSVWTQPITTRDVVFQLDTDDPSNVLKELAALGFSAALRPR